MAGEQSVNRVSATFADLADAASQAARELGRLAGAELQAEKASRGLYGQITDAFRDMIEPLAEFAGTVSATADGLVSVTAALPGMRALAPLGDLVGQTFRDLANLGGIATRGLADLTSNLVKVTASAGQSAAAQEVAKAAGNFLGNTFNGVRVTAGALGGLFSRLMPELSRSIGQGLRGIGTGLAMLGGVARVALEGLRLLAVAAVKAANALVKAAYWVASTFASLAKASLSLVMNFIRGSSDLPSKLGASISGAFSGIGSLIAGPTLGLIQAALNPLNAIQGTVAPFIDALNPALMGQLNVAFTNLNAVIGRALVPIMGALIPIVRLFGDALVPVVAAFMPVAEQFASYLMDLATVALPVFAGLLMAISEPMGILVAALSETTLTLFNAFLPVINAVTVLLTGIVVALAPLLPALAGLVEALVALAMPLINLIIPPLLTGLRALAEAILWVVNKIRGWLFQAALEFGNMLGNPQLPKAVTPQAITPGASANAATRGSSWSGINELGRNLASATFAVGMTPEMKTAENTARMAAGVDALVQGQNKQGQVKFDGNKPGQGLR